jgi:hypothetical protein
VPSSGPQRNPGIHQETSLSWALFQVFELIEFSQSLEGAICLRFTHHGQGKADVNQNVVSNTSLERVIKADFLPDLAEVYSAATEAEIIVVNDADSFPRYVARRPLGKTS